MSRSSAPLPISRTLSPLLIACLLSTWLVWGSTYLAIKFALVGMPPFLMMGSRFVVAGLALLAFAMARGASLPSRLAWRNATLIGVLMLGGGMGCTAVAETSVGSGIVVSFIAVTPLLIVLLNLAFGVRPAWRQLIGIAVGITGVLMLTRGVGFSAAPQGLLAIAIGCTGWSLGSVLSQRAFQLAPGAMGFASEMICGGIFLLLLAWLTHEHVPSAVPPGAWLAWAYLVSFGSLIAFNAYMYLLGRVPDALATSYTYVNPVIALLLGVTLGGEQVTAWEWLSASIVLAGVVLLVLGRR